MSIEGKKHYFYSVLYFILQSITINYKSWILLGISLFILNLCTMKSPINGRFTNDKGNSYNSLKMCEGVSGLNPASWLTFLVGMVLSHWVHYWHHMKYSYPHNIIHDFHHRSNTPFNHFIQLLLEMVSIVGIILIKHTWLDVLPFLSFMDEWIIIFFYLFYTTIHNVNYTIFHVNHVHEIHHREFIKNMGPDICDIMMGTKYKPEEGLENTDHYIPNILFCTMIVLLLKYGWNHSHRNWQEWYESLVKWVFYSSVLFLFITSICLYKMDIDHAFDRDVKQINEKLGYIEK